MADFLPAVGKADACVNCSTNNPSVDEDCRNCQDGHYCSAVCRLVHESTHKPYCQLLQRIAETAGRLDIYLVDWALPFAYWGIFCANIANSAYNVLQDKCFVIILSETTRGESTFFKALKSSIVSASTFETFVTKHWSVRFAEFALQHFRMLPQGSDSLRVVVMCGGVSRAFAYSTQDLMSLAVLDVKVMHPVVFPTPSRFAFVKKIDLAYDLRSKPVAQYLRTKYLTEFLDKVSEGETERHVELLWNLHFDGIPEGMVIANSAEGN